MKPDDRPNCPACGSYRVGEMGSKFVCEACNNRWPIPEGLKQEDLDCMKQEEKVGKDVFNELSPIPEKEIDLGDGRILMIVDWIARGEMDHLRSSYLPIEIVGIIRRKREDEA